MAWIAKYNDGTELKQYDNGTEHLFKEIDQERLVSFEVRANSNKGLFATVNLQDGSVELYRSPLKFQGFEGCKFELIYFRRVGKCLGADEDYVYEHLGWKTNIEGHVFKRIIKITDKCYELSLK